MVRSQANDRECGVWTTQGFEGLGPKISLDIVPVANDATDLGRPQDQDVRYEEYVEDAKPLVRLLPVDVILGRGGFFVEIV